MRHKPNPAIASRIAKRSRVTLIKRLAAKGMPPDEIAEKTGQSLGWVKLTLEDFDPVKDARDNEQRKARAQQTREQRGSRIGRPPKEENEEKSEEVEEIPDEDIQSAEDKPSDVKSTPVETPVTVEDVLARFKRIRADFKAGRWKSIRAAAECEGLELALVTRLIEGKKLDQ
jgi:hypothetical protein